MRRLDNINRLGSCQCVAFAALCACQAQNNHHGKLHAAGGNSASRFYRLFAVNTLVDSLQRSVVACFHAVIQKLQACFLQLAQLLLALAQDILGRSIAGNSLQMRKLLAQHLQNLQQLGRGQHQSIAVRQKDAAHLVLAVMGRQRYLTGNFFIL